MRDGFEVPLVMSYDKNFFNEKSPWIMFTNGANSQKQDLQFDHTKLSLMNRGMCLCYPLIRGKCCYRPVVLGEIKRLLIFIPSSSHCSDDDINRDEIL